MVNNVNKFIMPNGDEVKIGGGSGLEVCDIGMALYIDETKGLRRYLNGQIVSINANTQAFLDRLKEITTLHPSLLCTEEEWQTAKTMSAFGQVGKFVFNYSGDEIVSARIPAIVNVQGLFDLQNLGMTVEAGLPNITGSFGIGDSSGTTTSGVFYTIASTRWNEGGGKAGSNPNVGFNASRSSSIYGKSSTVQPEAIQYPYFIQIATGQETEANIVNTLENVNGFTLLENKYSDKPLYNESWLLSNGQWNAKSVYPTAYEGLQVEYNTEIEVGTTVTLPSGVSYTKRGLSVKLSTETYTDYDFVLNTAEESFRLPLKTKQKFYEDIAPVVGNGMALGLADGNGTFSGLSFNTANSLLPRSQVYGKTLPYTYSTGAGDFANQSGVGVVQDSTKSGIETHLTETTLYLYYYVGDIDQNHGIVNMGRIAEQIVDIKSNILWIKKYVNNFVVSTSFASKESLTLDFSSYLPDDGNMYEVLCSVLGKSLTAQCPELMLNDSINTSVRILNSDNLYANSRCGQQFLIVIDNSRKATIQATEDTGTISVTHIRLQGYRRLG